MATSLMKYSEVAARIHASESTARRLGRAGRLEEVRISPGAVRVRVESVQQLLDRGYDAMCDDASAA